MFSNEYDMWFLKEIKIVFGVITCYAWFEKTKTVLFQVSKKLQNDYLHFLKISKSGKILSACVTPQKIVQMKANNFPRTSHCYKNTLKYAQLLTFLIFVLFGVNNFSICFASQARSSNHVLQTFSSFSCVSSTRGCL